MTECKNCGKPIFKGQKRLVLTINENPSFCSEKCFWFWLGKNYDTVKTYVREVLTTETGKE